VVGGRVVRFTSTLRNLTDGDVGRRKYVPGDDAFARLDEPLLVA